MGGAKHIFVTGQPGVGKSTLIARVLENLHAAGLPLSAVQGFYTAEVRRGGERVGFDIVAVGAGAPARGPLARLGAAVPQGAPTVGKYVVDVPSIEAIALPTLRAGGPGVRLLVIDEVGKMELACPEFFPAVEAALTAGPVVLGSVPVPRYGRTVPQVEQVKARPEVEVVAVSKANRDALVAELAGKLRARLAMA